jgi:hypothetical protein
MSNFKLVRLSSGQFADLQDNAPGLGKPLTLIAESRSVEAKSFPWWR